MTNETARQEANDNFHKYREAVQHIDRLIGLDVKHKLTLGLIRDHYEMLRDKYFAEWESLKSKVTETPKASPEWFTTLWDKEDGAPPVYLGATVIEKLRESQAVPSVEDIEAGNEYVLSLPDLEYTTHDDDGLYTLRLRDKTDGVIVNAWEMETAPELWRKMNLLCSGASGYKWTKA